jgi:hypothetical protein
LYDSGYIAQHVTVAMIVGLVPVALGLDPGAASRRALGIVVIGGLSTPLVLTPVLVPLFDRSHRGTSKSPSALPTKAGPVRPPPPEKPRLALWRK